LKKPNILFLWVDAFRSDLVFGEERHVVSPNFDRLRDGGVAFPTLISSNAMSHPCFATLITGTYAFKHGITTFGNFKLKSEMKTLPEILKEAGYNTYGDMAGRLNPEMGFDRGFDEYRVRYFSENIHGKWGKDVFEKFRKKHYKEPWFLMLHIWVLHRSRFLTKEFNKKKFGRTAYERAFSNLDFKLGEILEMVPKDTIVIISGDHGEVYPKTKLREYINHFFFIAYGTLRKLKIWNRYYLGESHGSDLSEDVVKTPMIIYNAPGLPKKKRIEQQVRMIDIAPTIVEVLGLNGAIKQQAQGRSLLPLIKGEKMSDEPVYVAAQGIKLRKKEKWMEGVRTSDFKLVTYPFDKSRKPELFDLRKDPGGKKNIAGEMPGKVEEMLSTMQEIKGGRQFTEQDEKDVLERLRDLQYED